MSQIFTIAQSIIKSVNDETARELVARLCRAELRMQGLPESAVTWGGDQCAKDGGVDVRVDCHSPLLAPNFIKTPNTVIQVKAERFPASKIQKEMAPSGSLRPAILELKETGGSYIIVSTKDDVSDSELKLRKDAINNCLAHHEIGDFVQSDFYDSRRIADWLEQYPSIATWLRYKIGLPLKGWRPYGPWAYGENNPETEYLIDDRVRVFVPGAEEGNHIANAITQLRNELEHTVSVRIVGLSGVGKTRLVQALFDPRVCPESEAPASENVIYVDLSDEADPQPQTMLESLYVIESDSIVIIDNCGPDTHKQLTEIVKRNGSNLKLITIEYDIRDDLPEDSLCYRLEGSSSEIIKTLLNTRYKSLSDSDLNCIVEFSDGNARVAFALASTAENGGELSQLRSRELFERLFQQKNASNDDLLRCAEAASILYSFDGSDTSPNGEVARLATLAEVTPLMFLRHMAELKRRGLLQERGKWKAVLPHAISNGLAMRMLQAAPSELLHKSFIEQSNERIAISFSRRLGFLHHCEEAVAIASRVFAVDGRLGELNKLSISEQQMFKNLAPVNPDAALNAIERAMNTASFLLLHNDEKARFSRTVLSIAYEPDYFDRAVSILIRFALAEPEGCKFEPALDKLKSLFHCQLSGTRAMPEQRHKVVESLIASPNEKERSIAFDLISAGLKTSHFNSSQIFEFGSRRRDYGWHPRSSSDIKNWFEPFINIATKVGEQDDADGKIARQILGKSWRGIWGRLGLDDELVSVANRLKIADGWPEGWLGIRRVLQFDISGLKKESLLKLKELEETLAPSDLVSEIRARILTSNSFSYYLDQDYLLENQSTDILSPSEKRSIAQSKAEVLGARAANSPDLIEALLAELCSSEANNFVLEFGLGIGKSLADVPGLLKAARAHIEGAQSNNLSLIWIRGLILGWKEINRDAVEMFLDDAVDDIVWRNWFVELQIRVDLDTRAFDRLLHALDHNQCPTWQFSYLAMGRATDPLSVLQIISLAEKLLLRHDKGLYIAIDILAMVVLCTDNKSDQYKSELGNGLLNFLEKIDWSILSSYNTSISHDLDEIIKFALLSTESEIQVKSILKRIIPEDQIALIGYDDVRKDALKQFFQYFPRLSLEAICIPDNNGDFDLAAEIVSNPYSDRGETALELVPTNILVDWCNENPDTHYLFAASTCKLFNNQIDKKDTLKLSDTISALLTATPDKHAFIMELIQRFRPRSWSGSLADILEAQLPILDELGIIGQETINTELAEAKVVFQKWIDAERAREKEDSIARNSSFE